MLSGVRDQARPRAARHRLLHRAGVPHSIVVCLLALGGLRLLTSNPGLTAATFLAAALLVVLLWRPGAPLVLLFATGMLWLQPAMKVLHADALDLPVSQMTLHPATMDDAILLSLLATLSIAVGMRFAAAFAPDTLRQPVLAIGNLQWVFLFALACAVFVQRRGYLILGAIVLAQLIVGFTGFFAGFKDVLFLLFIVALTVRPDVSFERIPRLLAGAAVIICFGLV